MNAADAASETLMGHLLELRARLLRAVLVVVALFLALMPFAKQVYAWFAAPLLANLPEGGMLLATEPVGPFFTTIKLVFFVALMAAMPWVLYQAWAFVAPGLYAREKRLARPLLLAAVALFYAGCAFAWYLVLPAVFRFVAMFSPEEITQAPDIAKHLSFVQLILFAFGLSFELPVAVVVLVLLGIVTPAQLREARGYVIVGVFIFAAVITPPDVVSQLMLAIPMCLLYELGIVVGALLHRSARAG